MAPQPTAEQVASKWRRPTFPFSPLMFFPLMVLPYGLAHFKVSPYYVLPLSFFWLSYLHNIKLRRDRASALQLAADPVTLAAIVKHLPACK
jgi:hypothetical protein